jgi:hypothetical protein
MDSADAYVKEHKLSEDRARDVRSKPASLSRRNTPLEYTAFRGGLVSLSDRAYLILERVPRPETKLTLQHHVGHVTH